MIAWPLLQRYIQSVKKQHFKITNVWKGVQYYVKSILFTVKVCDYDTVSCWLCYLTRAQRPGLLIQMHRFQSHQQLENVLKNLADWPSCDPKPPTNCIKSQSHGPFSSIIMAIVTIMCQYALTIQVLINYFLSMCEYLLPTPSNAEHSQLQPPSGWNKSKPYASELIAMLPGFGHRYHAERFLLSIS